MLLKIHSRVSNYVNANVSFVDTSDADNNTKQKQKKVTTIFNNKWEFVVWQLKN